ncbi:hypothetical protein E4T66_17785 [Sinimarinibacterium sp. CAU 1509]|uniref:ParB/RepB/Spo0J family partition protein n=1 Tax=Sinimarinibacterium sp. CAU 1509 TaxID=2562283 RepID=UPI0010ACAB34|nr:ParB N-terminal domain-containing protein [Sinimarinibacterium sp. CAU 1509]TJY57259.1 hypothetical protein E4T66_17785 [Sinimarinibacterium sp. CAU 1509]
MSGMKLKLGGKAARIAAAQQHTDLIGQQVATPVRRNEFADIAHIPVDSVRPDHDQSRRLGVTLEMLRDPESVTDPALRAKVESIIQLADTMKSADQRNPIEVYRDGGVYRLLSGERRWWAAQVAGLERIAAKILPDRPTELRLKQLVENVQREDLTTPELFHGLRAVVEEAAANEAPITGAIPLGQRVGLSRTAAFRWWSVLTGPSDVSAALEAGHIGLRAAEAAVKIADPEERAAFVEQARQSEGSVEDLTARRKIMEAAAPPKKAQRGRPKSIALGSVRSQSVARYVMTKVLGREPADVNWDDPKAVTEAFKAMLKELEKELQTK